MQRPRSFIEQYSDHTHSTWRWENGQWRQLQADPIAPESPFAIRILYGPKAGRTALDFAIAMRSPGNDQDLILGYLFSEGIIHSNTDVDEIELVSQEAANVYLNSQLSFDPAQYQRVGYANSSCGLCGKADLKQVQRTIAFFPAKGHPLVPPTRLQQLPQLLREQQNMFSTTGGIHATALFTADGELLKITEDVGRHNALDKLLGWALQHQQFPWRDRIVLLSGRISYELVQKAAMAGTPILAAIGAPSSAAIELAEASGMTLVGFVRQDRLNVYTYPDRVLESEKH
ncbi:MAG: formate dehydrogenase accessory sulfurtransferase FdhD [Bacteroidota bacterium]